MQISHLQIQYEKGEFLIFSLRYLSGYITYEIINEIFAAKEEIFGN